MCSLEENEMNISKPVACVESFFEVVRHRHSVRKYRPHEIPDRDLAEMFEAARLAPSANNSQPWRFIIVRDPETKKLLSRPRPQTFIADANLVVVVIGDTSASCCPRATWTTRDPIIATEHLVLAATALGYGTCWIAMYESRPRDYIEEVKEALKIPDHMEIVCLVAIGVPDGEHPRAPKKEIHEICFLEEYGYPFQSGRRPGEE